MSVYKNYGGGCCSSLSFWILLRTVLAQWAVILHCVLLVPWFKCPTFSSQDNILKKYIYPASCTPTHAPSVEKCATIAVKKLKIFPTREKKWWRLFWQTSICKTDNTDVANESEMYHQLERQGQLYRYFFPWQFIHHLNFMVSGRSLLY